MDLANLGGKLGVASFPGVLRKARELDRLSRVRFNSSAFGLGEICKSILCFELACTQLQVVFDRRAAICISGLSEKSYLRCLAKLQNALGLRHNVDVRELAIQFGCVRLIASVRRALTQYKQRFVASLPESRKAHADFSRAVFTAVAFYLCARRNKLKLDRGRLIEVCGTSEAEFANISASMVDLCYDLVGLEREKKQLKPARCNKDLSASSLRKKRMPAAADSANEHEADGDDDMFQVSQLLKRSRVNCDVS